MKREFTICALLLAFAASVIAQQDRPVTLEEAYGEVLAAEQALREAEARREAGVEPLEGERLGIVGEKGRPRGSRLSPEYFERQQSLNDEVERARARLDRAYQRWGRMK